MKQTKEKVPLPKSTASNSQTRSKQLPPFNTQQEKINTLQLQKSNSLNQRQIEQKENQSTQSTINQILKERDLNSNVQTPTKFSTDDSTFKTIQSKLQQLEDQISKIEYTQDTFRPIMRQIQTSQGQQTLLSKIQKQNNFNMSAKDLEKQAQLAQQQNDQLLCLKVQVKEQMNTNEELIHRNLENCQQRKNQVASQLENITYDLSLKLKESEKRIYDDKNLLVENIQEKQESNKQEIFNRIQQLKEKSQQSISAQQDKMQQVYEKIESLQKKYGGKLQQLEQSIEPSYSQLKSRIDINDLQIWFNNQLEDQMKKSMEQMQGKFGDRIKKMETQIKNDNEKISEQIQTINKSIVKNNISESERNSEAPTFKIVTNKNIAKTMSNSPISELSNNFILCSKDNSADEIKDTLTNLETYQVKQSEDINEEIENLMSCITSNTQALEKSLSDLQKVQSIGKELEEGANRILSQFEQFSCYIKGEISKIRKTILSRQQQSDSELKALDGKINYKLKDQLISKAQSDKFKDYIETLKKHLQNTQSFLQREANQIDMKLIQLQTFVVKEIEPFIPENEDQTCGNLKTIGSTISIGGGIGKSNISAIPEEGAEYMQTDENNNDSLAF